MYKFELDCIFTDSKTKDSERYFPMNVKQHLLEIVREAKMLQKNVTVPYGYHIDFVVCMNNKDQIVEAGNSAITKQYVHIAQTVI